MISSSKPDAITLEILQSPNENKNIEFKPSFKWPQNRDEFQKNPKAQEVVLTILGMSNGINPGRVYIGVDGKNHSALGLEDEVLKTYDHDLIYSQIRNFGTPEPKFQIVHQEKDNIHLIVFAIQTFTISPIISRNPWNLSKLDEATIYIRTDKPETKKITAPYEMKDLYDLGIDREIEHLTPRIRKMLDLIKGEEEGIILKSSPANWEKFLKEFNAAKEL